MKKDLADPSMIAVAAEAQSTGDPLPMWDFIRGLKVSPSAGSSAQDEAQQWQYEFFHLAKTLAIADYFGACYEPVFESELQLLHTKMSVSQDRRVPTTATPMPVLTEVGRLLVPDLRLDLKTAVEIRQSEGAFEDWRARLRTLVRDGASDSPAELRDRVRRTQASDS